MDEINPGVMDEVAPASSDDGSTTPVPDGSAPGAGSFRPDGQWVPYTRFKEVNDGYRSAEARAAAAEARATALETQAKQQGEGLMQRLQSLENSANQRQLTPAEREEFDKAIKALDLLHQQHPTLKHLPQMISELPKLMERLSALENTQKESMSAQQQAYVGRHVEAVHSAAKAAGFPEETYAQVENAIAGVIRSTPEALRLLQQGDTRVVQWAFNQVYGHAIRQQNAATMAIKQQTQRLPPVSRSGAPGTPAAPTIVPGDPKSVAAYKRWERDQVAGRSRGGG